MENHLDEPELIPISCIPICTDITIVETYDDWEFKETITVYICNSCGHKQESRIVWS